LKNKNRGTVMVNVIAIDGPAGSGKSTVAKIIAEKKGFVYINTGAMYRAIGLYCDSKDIPCNNDAITEKLFENITIDFDLNGNILLNGENISDKITSPKVAKLASDYSALPNVRKYLTKLQREIGLKNPSVLEGRDIGTVVFPDADHKFFIDASPEERAKRRLLQLKEKDNELQITVEELLKQQMERDNQDKNRKVAPLKKAEDAIYIDTTGKNVDEVVEEIIKYL
jgi:cytidylate kinase